MSKDRLAKKKGDLVKASSLYCTRINKTSIIIVSSFLIIVCVPSISVAMF